MQDQELIREIYASVKVIESNCKTQCARIKKLENDTEDLKAFKWKATGIASTISLIGSYLWNLVIKG